MDHVRQILYLTQELLLFYLELLPRISRSITPPAINNMSKKNTYIIIFVVLVLLLLGLIFYYLNNKNTDDGNGGMVNTFKNFFPFGGSEVVDNNTGSTTPEEISDDREEPVVDFVKKLRKLSSEPVAGAGLLDVKAGTVVRYIEKATGHIFEVELFSPRQGRISNTTIPKVYDAVWGNKNNSLITRYLKDDDRTVETYSLTVKDLSTTTENIITGIAFPNKISDVSVVDTGVFYLEQSDTGSSGYVSNWSGGNKKQIWNSPIKEIISQYVNSKTVALTTKSEENTEGFLYFVDTSNGTSRRILGNIIGLSTLTDSSATRVLYLKLDQSVEMFLYDMTMKTRNVVYPVTFPEKCVWSSKSKDIVFCAVPKEGVERASLTSWYKGLNQFSDDIWKYDLKNNTANIVLSMNSETSEDIDVIKPILSESEQYLVFMNKRDNALWSLDLTK